MTFWNQKGTSEIHTKPSGGSEHGLAALNHTITTHPQLRSEDLDLELIERFGELQSALSAGTRIEGKLAFDKPVRIDGELKGEIIAPAALVLIGAEAKVEAQISAACLVVLGRLSGDVKALQRMELLKGSSFQGSLQTPVLVVQDGAIFNGNCHMQSEHQETRPSTQSSAAETRPTQISEGDAFNGLTAKQHKETTRESTCPPLF